MSDESRFIPLGSVPSLAWLPLRRRGSRLNKSTLYRWAGIGSRGVKLQTVCVGSQRCTTAIWLNEFFSALAARETAADIVPQLLQTRFSKTRRRAHEQAQRQLAAFGL